jgi:hypothetical protein
MRSKWEVLTADDFTYIYLTKHCPPNYEGWLKIGQSWKGAVYRYGDTSILPFPVVAIRDVPVPKSLANNIEKALKHRFKHEFRPANDFDGSLKGRELFFVEDREDEAVKLFDEVLGKAKRETIKALIDEDASEDVFQSFLHLWRNHRE